MVKFHLSKNFGGLLKGTSCKTDFLSSLLDSNIYFLIVTLTLLKRKRATQVSKQGPHSGGSLGC